MATESVSVEVLFSLAQVTVSFCPGHNLCMYPFSGQKSPKCILFLSAIHLWLDVLACRFLHVPSNDGFFEHSCVSLLVKLKIHLWETLWYPHCSYRFLSNRIRSNKSWSWWLPIPFEFRFEFFSFLGIIDGFKVPELVL